MYDFKVRYLASYHGPSYGECGWVESMDAYPSLKAAEAAMRGRQLGYSYDQQFIRNADELWVHNGSNNARFPATTNEDWMDVHEVIEYGPFGSLLIAAHPAFRLSVGPRGGIIRVAY